jgi:hypothetical protein
MAYAVENAIFQWEDGERQIRQTPEPARGQLERAVMLVLDELRRRLGSAFTVEELASFYANDIDWALDIAQREGAGTDSAAVVDATFNRYAREATNYAGGRARETTGRAQAPGET